MSINTANDLLKQLLSTTGSRDIPGMKWCISVGEGRLRNVDLPLLSSDPYSISSIGIANSNGAVPVPADMRTPIQFFKNGVQFTAVIQCTGTQGSNRVNLLTAPPQPLAVGMGVTGTGIAIGTTVVSYTNQIATLSSNNLTNINSALTFKSDPTIVSQTGPWAIYNRVGSREGIKESFGVFRMPSPAGAVISNGTFFEVSGNYFFNPPLTNGEIINMYYYKSVPKLFSPIGSSLISATADITNVTLGGTYWNAVIQLPSSGLTTNIQEGDTVYATSGSGTLNTNEAEVVSVTSSSIRVRKYNDGINIVAGTITDLMLNNTVKSNIILSSFPEGYFYSSLVAYYNFNNLPDKQAQYENEFNKSISIIEEQNSKGIYSGGETTFTSPFLPRSRLKRGVNQIYGR